jgi:putative ABC transport system substrate-binding protein
MKGNAASMRLRLGPFAYSESAGADHRYDRRKFLMAVAVAWLVTQPGLSREMVRIGYLSPLTRTTDKVRNDAFRRGLADLGYIPGMNIQIEERFADGHVDMLPISARELVDRQVSLIVAAGGTFVAQSVKTVTSTIPIN